MTRVSPSPRRWNVTTPACSGPSSDVQAIRSSGRCSVMTASNSFVFPATLVTQWVWVSSSWRTSSTPSMKCGELLELGPLVVRGPYGDVHVDALLDRRHLGLLLVL